MKLTETPSNHDNLESKTVLELLNGINLEDLQVALSVQKSIPQIEKIVNKGIEILINGGKIFYIGAGTSGRLGILDASELPPTYGVSHDLILGVIAGGDSAIRKAVEGAEDDVYQGWVDIQNKGAKKGDMVLGISASGSTPYVMGGLKIAQENGLITACIVNNPNSPIASLSMFPIEVITGAEYVTGSTRMKAGTAQKLVLNMISTSIMIKLGRVKGNKMVDMMLSNNKLVERGTKMIMDLFSLGYDESKRLLMEEGSVRKVIDRINARN